MVFKIYPKISLGNFTKPWKNRKSQGKWHQQDGGTGVFYQLSPKEHCFRQSHTDERTFMGPRSPVDKLGTLIGRRKKSETGNTEENKQNSFPFPCHPSPRWHSSVLKDELGLHFPPQGKVRTCEWVCSFPSYQRHLLSHSFRTQGWSTWLSGRETLGA